MSRVEIIQQKGYNFLWVDDYLWMWDIPAEVKIQLDLAIQAHGDVLVVGCGLGVIQRFLASIPSVNSETLLTIEKTKEVPLACREHGLEVPGGMFICDFYDAIAGCDEGDQKYDFVIGDIWPEIAPECLSDYIRFKKKAEEFLKKDGRILAWGQGYFEYLIDEQRKV